MADGRSKSQRPFPGGRLSNAWNISLMPSARHSMLALLVAGGIGGVVFWGGFNTAMEATNTMTFCISCHEMKENVYKEYATTIHHQNRTGVSASCSDCHVPKEWWHKIVRKIQASNEVFHHLMGSVSTPEKFDKKRLQLASNVWASMKATDSRECRNCHTIESMNPEFQRPRARKQHLEAMKAGNTCIDCHKGIAHKGVRDKLDDKTLEELEKPLAAYVRQIPATYMAGLARAEKREAEQAAQRKAEVDTAAKALAAEQVKSALAAAAAAAPAAKAAAPAAGAPAATPAPAGAPSQVAQAAAGSAAAAGTAGGPDWGSVEAQTVTLFYPGQSSFEWIQNGKEHGGARAFLRGGERCAECHAKEVKDMGAKIVSGQKIEPTPIAGKRPFVDVRVQAAYDASNLHLRFQWPNAPHTPAAFVPGGKMDPQNAAKLAVMFIGADIERAEQAGCWVTCHHDSRYMPDAPKPEALAASPAKDIVDLKDGLTKYLAESRTAVELKGDDGKPRGGGDKVKSKDELAKLVTKGTFMDLLRFRSSGGGENGHVLEQRTASGGIEVKAEGKLEGDTWTVTMSRPLKSDKAGDITFEPGKLYTVSIALHDDHTVARFHHVSLEMRFGLDAKDAEIRAVKK